MAELEIIKSLITNPYFGPYFTHFTASGLEWIIRNAINLKPEIEKSLTTATTAEEYKQVAEDIVGTIVANAGNGNIQIEKSTLEALNKIHFDHQDGLVGIHNSVFQAPNIKLGGNGTGNTHITGSQFSAGGSGIDIDRGASIEIGGNASIEMG